MPRRRGCQYYTTPGTFTFKKSNYPWLARVRVRVQGADGGSAGANAATDQCGGRGLVTLQVISFGEPAVADEGAGEAGEGQEVLGFAFV
ncbi:hypothetical protein ACH4NF_29370, partial [Streptomyces sp. NPDC017248]